MAVNPRLVQAERTAVLRAAHPCVVVPRPDGTTPDLARLRGFASGRLARHKLPEDVVVLNALPFTAGEKVGTPAGARTTRRLPLTPPERPGA